MTVKSRFFYILVSAGVLAGCGGASSEPPAIRLVDRFKPAMVEGQEEVPRRELPRTEWRFDGSTEKPKRKYSGTYGWQAGHGIAGLTVREGRLRGRSTQDFPVVHVERTSGVDDADLLHSIEVRLRVSAGAKLAFSSQSSEKLDVADVVKQAQSSPWRTNTPIIAGVEFRTYTLRPPNPIPSSAIRHLLLRSSDVKEARFEIESVRLIFRREHLASISTGVGWHGLAMKFRETLVALAPVRIRMELSIPKQPWLDLAVGTIEYGPVTFQASVGPAGNSSSDLEKTLFERTVTTPHRWETARVDLSEFAGQEVSLSLGLAAEQGGALGFWGSPVVRDDGADAVREVSARNAPQGVILIMADTLRSDHLDAYGYGRSTAPVLRKLADEGALFRDCLSQATWTKVSTPSLMTSLYPSTHGVAEIPDRLPESATTLAEVFREAGFATLSMSSVPFSGQMTNLHQGFEELHERSSISEGGSKTAREYIDRLLPWLDTHREVPFFVFLHVFDPHDPFEPRKPFNTLWAGAERGEEHKKQMEELKKFIKEPFMKNRALPKEEELKKSGLDREAFLSHLHDWYDGSIRGMDAEIGRLLGQLRTLGLEEKTLIVFTSDHGEEFLEHGWTFHGQSVYGELNNIPLILYGPGTVPAGVVVDQTVQSIDVMPTVLELSGLPVPKGIQGRSLVPFFENSSATRTTSFTFFQEGDEGPSSVRGEVAKGKIEWDRPAMSEKAAIKDNAGPRNGEMESIAFLKDGWKLIRNRKESKGESTYELFNHRKDPLNLKDLAAEKVEVVEQLAPLLDEMYAKAQNARLEPDLAPTQKMSAEELERLRSLGYIQ